MTTRKRDTRGAYSKVGNPSETRGEGVSGLGSSSSMSRCLIITFAITILLFFVSMAGPSSSGNKNVDSDNLRSGQAHHSSHASNTTLSSSSSFSAGTTITTTNSTTSTSSNFINEDTEIENTNGGNNDDDMSITPDELSSNVVTEEDVDGAVDAVGMELRFTEQNELDDSSLLMDAVKQLGSFVRIGVSKMFGSDLSNEEVEAISEEIEIELKNNAEEELNELADVIVTEKMDQIEQMVDVEESEGLAQEDIEEDVYNREEDATNDIKEKIASAEAQVTDHLKAKAAEIEKQILEDRLSNKLGKTVKLIIVDDEVHKKNIDDMVSDLPNLGAITPNTVTTNTGASTGTTVGAVGYTTPVQQQQTAAVQQQNQYGQQQVQQQQAVPPPPPPASSSTTTTQQQYIQQNQYGQPAQVVVPPSVPATASSSASTSGTTTTAAITTTTATTTKSKGEDADDDGW